MNDYLNQQINIYDATRDIEDAVTPPSSWYTSREFAVLENATVFANNWIMVARKEQLEDEGQYVVTEVCDEPVVVVRGDKLRAFYNVW